MGNIAGVPSHRTISFEHTPKDPLLTLKDLLEVNEVKTMVNGLSHFFHQHGKYQQSKRKRRCPKCHGRHHEHQPMGQYPGYDYPHQPSPVRPYPIRGGRSPHIVPDDEYDEMSHDGFSDVDFHGHPEQFSEQRPGYRLQSQHLGGYKYHDRMPSQRRAVPREYSNDRHAGGRSRTRNPDDIFVAGRAYPQRRRGGGVREEHPADAWGEQSDREETNWDERRENVSGVPFGQGERSPPGKRRR